ncbi:MAG: glutamate formimidoyltransferase, partial [Chloroflexia bacterium]
MVAKVMVCAANFSEGRDASKVEEIAAAVRTAGAIVLDVHMDADHNRSVITFLGGPSRMLDGAFQAVQRSVELLDLTGRGGVHPRIGVADVVPFVPYLGVTEEACAKAARSLARRIAEELTLPTYLYGGRRSARPAQPCRRSCVPRAHRRSRRGYSTDFGPSQPHPTAGVARAPLIAFNCVLDRPELEAAKRIAARVRESGGGLPGVRALGFLLESKGLAQVAMNITDLKAVSLVEVVERVQELAKAEGAEVARSELVGLIPMGVALNAAARALLLPSLRSAEVLEQSAVHAIASAEFQLEWDDEATEE